MEKYQTLHGDVEKLRNLRRLFIDAKENLFSVGTTLQALRRKRIAELNIIYPISQVRKHFLLIDIICLIYYTKLF